MQIDGKVIFRYFSDLFFLECLPSRRLRPCQNVHTVKIQHCVETETKLLNVS